jgi:hypothetical protein
MNFQLISCRFFLLFEPKSSSSQNLMSLTCSSADVTSFTTNSAALQTCVAQAQGTDIFPSGSAVQTCMESITVSTECGQCWGNLYGDFKSCFVDTCDFNPETPLDAQLPQGCIDCLANIGTSYYLNNDICGVALADVPSGSGATIAEQVSKWTTSTDVDSTTKASSRMLSVSLVVAATLFMLVL